MPKGQHNRKLSDEQRDEIVRRYTTPLPDGGWEGVPSLAREFGVYPNAVYGYLKRRGVATRSTSQTLRNRPVGRRPPIGAQASCKCGCGSGTEWNYRKGRWNAYVVGHYRQNAPYKNPQWLRIRYITERKTLTEMAAECGVSTSSVVRFMRRFGIDTRSTSEAHIGRQSGEANPSWKGGVTPERQRLYKSAEWKRVIGECFARDDYLCQRCGTAKVGRVVLHAHHVVPWADSPELRMEVANLVTLCNGCHVWVHSRQNVLRDFLA